MIGVVYYCQMSIELTRPGQTEKMLDQLMRALKAYKQGGEKVMRKSSKGRIEEASALMS